MRKGIGTKLVGLILYVFYWVITLFMATFSILGGIATWNYGDNLKGNLIIGVAVGLLGASAINFLTYLMKPIVIILWRIFRHEPYELFEVITKNK